MMKKTFCFLIICVIMLSMLPAAQANEYMNVYAPEGRVEVIKTADFDAWHAVGWYSAPVMYVYALDGRCELILKSNYYTWSQVGWYDAPKMYVYSPYNQTKLINKSDFDYYHANGWYSAPVMYVYAPDGRKQLVLESDAPAWKAVGWDYQTGYADNIPWTSDYQYWAVINLNCGPYSDWHQNRNYYIDKYFIEMPEKDRKNIKHYEFYGGEIFLVIPRYKETITLSRRTLSLEGSLVEVGIRNYIANGTPFTMNANPSCMWANNLIKSSHTGSEGTYFRLSSVDSFCIEGSNHIDLTEWHYSPFYYSYY